VIGNGDVLTGEDAKKLVEMTGCDGVMIGRGALGNPWIYRATEKALRGRAPEPEPSFEERKRVAIRHVEMEFEFEGEWIGFLNSKRIACWYFKHCPGIGQFRNQINRCESPAEMRRILEGFEPCRAKPRV